MYKVITNNKIQYLEKEVNEFIQMGYIPLGGPIIKTDGSILQALIRESKGADKKQREESSL